MHTYKANWKQSVTFWKKDNFMADYGLFNMSLGQDFRIVETQYVMLSFDAAMALLGGYAALIWQILGLLVGWHQDFSYNNALGL